MEQLRVVDVYARYTDVDILRGITIRVEEREIVTIIGPNGSGKSTLLKTIIGFLKPHRGAIEFQGFPISGLPVETIIRKEIAYVPQVANIFPSLTVRENLEVSVPRKAGDPEVRIQSVLKTFPKLNDRLKLRSGALSGGERQMLAIGKALVTKPRLVILDEPTAGLSPLMAKTIFEVVQKIRDENTTVLMAEQNAKMALKMSDRGYVLEFGKVAMEGEGRRMLDDPMIGKLYLGDRMKEQ